MQKTEIINEAKHKSVVLYDEMSSSYLSYAMSVTHKNSIYSLAV